MNGTQIYVTVLLFTINYNFKKLKNFFKNL